jgi:hypothetical protein
MDSFPSDFNLESLLKEKDQFDNTNPSLKEQRKRIYTYMQRAVPQGCQEIVFDLPIGMTTQDRQQLVRELCERFPNHVDYKKIIDVEEEVFILVEDPNDPPISSDYRIRIK